MNKGQTSCYTGMVYDYAPRKSQAQGKHAIPNSDAYKGAKRSGIKEKRHESSFGLMTLLLYR